ncbi:MAG: hypothetical protein Kow006_31150 [Gammaproteobacteria bacterium]
MKPKLFMLLPALLLAACGSGNDSAVPTSVQLGDPARGQSAFQKNCAECHGNDAKGTDKGPPLIHRYYEPGHHADIAFQLAVKQGVRQHHWSFGDMPPQPEVSASSVNDIIAWVRQEQRKAGIR